MRIRSIKPEFWRSEDISELERDDRLLFVGLWSYVDDNGVGLDRLAEVAADLFAHDLERDPRETFARVQRGLEHLAAAGLIHRYEVDGRAYLEVATWKDHQRIDRPAKPRYPRHDWDRDTVATDSRQSREDAATGTGEQGNRGTGDQDNPRTARGVVQLHAAVPEGAFDAFWAAYPRKAGKKPAEAAFVKAARSAHVAEIIDGARRFAADPNLPEQQYVPHASTWLNQCRWDDPPLPPRGSRGAAKDEQALGLVASLRAQEEAAAAAGRQIEGGRS